MESILSMKLITKAIEPIETRLVRAVGKGENNPAALVYDTTGVIAQKVKKIVLKIDPTVETLYEENEKLSERDSRRTPYHVVVANYIGMIGLMRFVLMGIVDPIEIAKLICVVGTTYPPNHFPVIGLAKTEESEYESLAFGVRDIEKSMFYIPEIPEDQIQRIATKVRDELQQIKST